MPNTHLERKEKGLCHTENKSALHFIIVQRKCFSLKNLKLIIYKIHWGRDKLVTILQMNFSNTFSWMNILAFWLKFTEAQCYVGSDYGFAWNRWQAIIWNQPGLICLTHISFTQRDRFSELRQGSISHPHLGYPKYLLAIPHIHIQWNFACKNTYLFLNGIFQQWPFEKFEWKCNCFLLESATVGVTYWECPCLSSSHCDLNTLRPRQNGRHFADDIFNCIFLNENVWISIKISLKFVPKDPINNIPTLVQIMAWRRLGDKPLSEPMVAG